MLNPAYDALRLFQNKFSEKHTIREIKALFGDPKLDLTIHFESNLPWSLAWDLTSNSLTGSCKITISPKLVINGELYEAPFGATFVMPASLECLENSFVEALKESLSAIARVWD